MEGRDATQIPTRWEQKREGGRKVRAINGQRRRCHSLTHSPTLLQQTNVPPPADERATPNFDCFPASA